MRSIYLKMQAFGPYADTQEVFFSEFEKSGIYLICGDTGSGKTSVLDGITYALYGKSSGGGRGKIADMRCQFAPRDLITEVVYIFELRGRRYKFVRTVKQNRKNLQTAQDVLYEDENGVFVPYFENPKIRDAEKKAEELIGLSYDQFCRVVILPQGQFERLLVADSEKKEEILTSLFGTERLKGGVERLYAAALDDLRNCERQIQTAENILAEWECKSLKELEDMTAKKAEELKAAEEEEENCRRKFEDARKKRECFAALEKQLEFLEEQEKAYALLIQRNEWAEITEKTLAAAKRAAEVYPAYNECGEAAKNFEDAKLKCDAAAEIHSNAESRSVLLAKRRKAFEDAEPKRREDAERLLKLKSLSDIYAEADSAGTVEKARRQTLEAAKAETEKAKKTEGAKKKAKIEAEAERAELYAQYAKMFAVYREGISGMLAGTLEKGMPCPVCGSLEHPFPAAEGENTVTEGELTKLQERIDRAAEFCREREKEFDSAARAFADTLEEEKNAQRDLDEAVIRKGEIYKRLDPEIPDKPSLEKEKEILQSGIDAAKKEENDINEAWGNIQKECAAAEARAVEAEKRKEDAKKTAEIKEECFLNRLSEMGFADLKEFLKVRMTEEEMRRTEAQLSAFYAEREKTKETIEELKASCRGVSAEELERQAGETQLKEKELGVIHEKRLFMKEEQKRREKVLSDMSKRQPEIWAEYDRCTDMIAFAKRLRGDSGIGISRYMLGVLFGSVIREANRLLTRVHGGRYSLCRSDEASGRARKTGLELVVFDALSGEKRPVEGLSGGEKFLVSLSLAIALSGVVRMRSGGVELKSMFIDEGFGALDGSSVADALDVLSAMRSGGATVGIISHLPVLRENLATGIRVIKEKRGSKLICGNF